MKPKFNRGDIIINNGRTSLITIKYIKDVIGNKYIASRYDDKQPISWNQDYIDAEYRLLTEKEKLELL